MSVFDAVAYNRRTGDSIVGTDRRNRGFAVGAASTAMLVDGLFHQRLINIDIRLDPVYWKRYSIQYDGFLSSQAGRARERSYAEN